MNTKIDGLTTPLTRAPVTAVPSAGAASAAKGGASAASDDSVQLSGEAVDLAALAKALGGAPAFDAAKVQAVRTALETGTYRIDAQDIARRLVQLERQLGM